MVIIFFSIIFEWQRPKIFVDISCLNWLLNSTKNSKVLKNGFVPVFATERPSLGEAALELRALF
jgi:hypothetical protein